MSDGSDIQRLEQRIAALEARLGTGGGGFTAPGGGGAGSGQITPAQWVAGALARSLPQGGPTGGTQAGQQAVGAQGFTGESFCWCTSRFVCATMNCGGSGWC